MFSEKSFSMETPVAVSIAGSDNSSGAGIQADLKTFTHFKVYAETVVTCVVAEVPGKVLSIQPIDQTIVRDQLNLGDEDRALRLTDLGRGQARRRF